MHAFIHQPDFIIWKILSYTEGNPMLYIQLASTCNKFFRVCTSDQAWSRFNVFGVENIYRHFTDEKRQLPKEERILYYMPFELWVEYIIWRNIKAKPLDQLNPYTQLLLILAPAVFCPLRHQITDRRVMQLGVLEPGNLIFYGCYQLRRDPNLVLLSLKSRQHIGMLLPPAEWSTELKISWHFAYADIDSEFQPPYSPDLYRRNLSKRRVPWQDEWSPTALMDLDSMDPATRQRIQHAVSTKKVVQLSKVYAEYDETLEDELSAEEKLALTVWQREFGHCLQPKFHPEWGHYISRSPKEISNYMVCQHTAAEYGVWKPRAPCTGKYDCLDVCPTLTRPPVQCNHRFCMEWSCRLRAKVSAPCEPTEFSYVDYCRIVSSHYCGRVGLTEASEKALLKTGYWKWLRDRDSPDVMYSLPPVPRPFVLERYLPSGIFRRGEIFDYWHFDDEVGYSQCLKLKSFGGEPCVWM